MRAPLRVLLALTASVGCGGGDAQVDDGPAAAAGEGEGEGEAPGEGPGPDGAPEEISLIDNAAWRVLGEDDDDPFRVEGETARDACPEAATETELTPDGLWFEIETQTCAWVTVRQPLAAAVAAGAGVRLHIEHWEVLAGDKDYRLALALGEGEAREVIWEQTVSLGAGHERFDDIVRPTGDHAAGAPIWFHLENHGDNSWVIASITLAPPDLSPGR